MGHDAPYSEIVALGNFYLGVIIVGWAQEEAFTTEANIFQGKFALDEAYYYIALTRFQRLIDDNDIALEDFGIDHRIAHYPTIESRRRVANEQLIEIEALSHIILCGARETCVNSAVGERQFHRSRVIYAINFEVLHDIPIKATAQR